MKSDQHLLIAKLRLKLKKSFDNNKSRRKVINTKRLNKPDVQRKFCLELRNKFRVLENLEQEASSLENEWQNIKQAYPQTAEKTIGDRKRNEKKWFTQNTWKTFDSIHKNTLWKSSAFIHSLNLQSF